MADDPLAQALMIRLLKLGVIDDGDVEAIANDIENRADIDDEERESAARIARASILRVMAPSASDWNAERARNRFKVFTRDGPDGGNAED